MVSRQCSYTLLIEPVVHLKIVENNKTEKKGLTLFAHPEDETLGLGGMFGFLAARQDLASHDGARIFALR